MTPIIDFNSNGNNSNIYSKTDNTNNDKQQQC